ncbi:serine/threonine protein kinase KIN1 NDAI_0J01250 [Naumovozyma dairenensis CBS 421]|uniref:non-specific serine/threonine protein kinase n=1 Tax=Naumovozyma dairenensis (strain ATCC 10597 / BCRC 20456 / CBS 421 / NBRC 0211 / NRRL Y-12639) TaxID=1071378 RepID=G0WGT9_NAUDC|nr:hypothetical protein NDAI_0J01250 [Naumovozyma dairenensis CBS 421]CCD27017.1 hypothetical protein NDAI_0J01250 [Naumovozyma dairenensis CBS 421]
MDTVNDYKINPGFKIGNFNPNKNTNNDTNTHTNTNTNTNTHTTPRTMEKNLQKLLDPNRETPEPIKTNNNNNDTNRFDNNNNNNKVKQFHRTSLGEWDFIETVGAGSMGKVKLARNRQTREVCAIKIVNRATKIFLTKESKLMSHPTNHIIMNEKDILDRQKRLEKEISRDRRTIREASLGQILYHPHICRLFEMYTLSNHFYMLFEYVSGGQLLDYIIQHGSLKESHARNFARQILSALKYLHANNIVHRDLKIENIMISSNGNIKIIDFGLSNLYDKSKKLKTYCGSLYFAAPELLRANPYIGPEIDVWSFGVVLYVLVCGKVPFDDENSNVLHEKIKQGRVFYPQFLSIEVISLLSTMLVVDPFKRATLDQVMKHHWMVKDYDSIPDAHLPKRVPLTSESIDMKVIKEMKHLEFIEDIEQTEKKLLKLISQERYQRLRNEYWHLKKLPCYNEKEFKDPTLAYHPLLSIYYLTDEMLKRKNPISPQETNEEKSTHSISKSTEEAVAKESIKEQTDIPVIYPSDLIQDQLQKTHIETSKSNEDDQIPPPIPALADTTPVPPTPVSQQEPLKIKIPTILPVPEKIHTSPLKDQNQNQNQNQNQDQISFTLSPKAQKVESLEPRTPTDKIQHVQTSPVIEPADKSTFGTLIRRLSQRRASKTQGQQGQQSQQSQPPQKQTTIQDVPMMKKTHMRAISDFTQPISKVLTSPSTSSTTSSSNEKEKDTLFKNNFLANFGITKSKDNKYGNSNKLPSLPQNAADLLTLESTKSKNKKTTQSMKTAPSPIANEQQPQQQQQENNNHHHYQIQQLFAPEETSKQQQQSRFGRTHRTRSVGHARRESLKFKRPSVTSSNNNNDDTDEENNNNNNTDKGNSNKTFRRNRQNENDTGFLQNSDDNDDDDDNEYGYENDNNSRSTNEAKDKEENEMKLLTDAEILREASKAPAGSMLSIDYPRSLFLKGFFSVQTTSSKPLPIVRYKIIHVLKKYHIQFKEVKGGFICIARSHHANFDTLSDNDGDSTMTTNHHLRTYFPGADSYSLSQRRRNSINKSLSSRTTTATATSNDSKLSPTADNTYNENKSIHNNNDNANITIAPPHNDSVVISPLEQSLNGPENKSLSSLTHTFEENKFDQNNPIIKFEIHIVKVRIVGLAGVHFKKVSGNTWWYKEIASKILNDLNL